MLQHYTLITLLLSLWGTGLGATVLELKSMSEYKELCAQNKPFVLMFYAPWCSACQGMKEPYDKVSGETSDVIMAKISTENPEFKGLKEAFCVTSIPTFITRQSGMMSQDALSTLVKGHIRQPLPQKTAPQAAPTKPEATKATT